MRHTMCRRLGRIAVAVGAIVVGSLDCIADPRVTEDFGLTFLTIGSPGNRNTIPSETPEEPFLSRGRVDYEYRLARTELTVGQYLEFVRAFQPYDTGNPLRGEITGTWVQYDLFAGTYSAPAGLLNWPADMGWRMAARYCNWLHNGKALTREAFETGAYDTSTFTQNPNGSFNDQLTRSPGAQYWIPSLDEWMKGAYYDPNRYGEGQEGYWPYPYALTRPAFSGDPSLGGETNAGSGAFGDISWRNVGTYPHVNEPWGLLDVSGGEREWLEEVSSAERTGRGVKGSEAFGSSHATRDNIDFLSGSGVLSGSPGFRLAAAVPSPAPTATLILAFAYFTRRLRP